MVFIFFLIVDQTQIKNKINSLIINYLHVVWKIADRLRPYQIWWFN